MRQRARREEYSGMNNTQLYWHTLRMRPERRWTDGVLGRPWAALARGAATACSDAAAVVGGADAAHACAHAPVRVGASRYRQLTISTNPLVYSPHQTCRWSALPHCVDRPPSLSWKMLCSVADLAQLLPTVCVARRSHQVHPASPLAGDSVAGPSEHGGVSSPLYFQPVPRYSRRPLPRKRVCRLVCPRHARWQFTTLCPGLYIHGSHVPRASALRLPRLLWLVARPQCCSHN